MMRKEKQGRAMLERRQSETDNAVLFPQQTCAAEKSQEEDVWIHTGFGITPDGMAQTKNMEGEGEC